MMDVPQTVTLEYVDDPACRDVFVETALVAMDAEAGVLRLELGVKRFSKSNPPIADRSTPVARLVMTQQFAAKLCESLTQTLKKSAESSGG